LRPFAGPFCVHGYAPYTIINGFTGDFSSAPFPSRG
jgi:hypothetical protein